MNRETGEYVKMESKSKQEKQDIIHVKELVLFQQLPHYNFQDFLPYFVSQVYVQDTNLFLLRGGPGKFGKMC